MYEIASKSDDLSLKYADLTICKMAAVRHLEFSKFTFYVKDSAFTIFVTYFKSFYYFYLLTYFLATLGISSLLFGEISV